MGVRGTENYIYYTDRALGSGATGVVYFGRHKKKGFECAVKIFLREGHSSLQSITKNELDWMKQLRHKNIVSLLGIEKDMKSGYVALVLEYCSYGSLDRLMKQPENMNGLPEEQFLNFLFQFCDGLGYLRMHAVSHRDIKPSNILCTKMEHGSIWYKITDFGASKDLFSENPAVFGTEEYLHPDAYKVIVINKGKVPRDMEMRSELWSIGVTLFEVVTGKLPFSVPGGRKNRLKMYELISGKKMNDISGYVKDDLQVEYFESLPKTCWLSKSIIDFTEYILKGLLETNHEKQMTFETLFPAVNLLSSLTVIKIFDVSSMVICNVYFDRCRKFSNFKEEVTHITGVKEIHQFYVIRWRRLEVDDDDLFCQTRPEVKDEVLILLSLDPKFPTNQNLYIGNYMKPSDKNLLEDVLWSKQVSGWCSRVNVHILDLIQKQLHLSELASKIQHILETLNTRAHFMVEKLQNVNSKSNVKNIVHLAQKFQKKFKNSSDGLPSLPSACFVGKCSIKAETVSRFSNEIRLEFEEDKNKTFNHNEEQIHKYRRSELEVKLKDLQDLYRNHCQKETGIIFDKFKQWYISHAIKCLNAYREIETTLQSSLNVEDEMILKALKENDILIESLEKLVKKRNDEIERIFSAD